MPNPRHEDRPHQSIEDTQRRTSERAADETSRIGTAAVRSGEDVVRASANLLQQNAETLKNTWRSSLDMTTAMMERSADQFGRTLGLSGDEAEQATERSARNAEMILHSTTAASKVMRALSREYFEFMRRQFESSMDRMNELSRCRTPQDFAALQTDLVRDSMASFFESSRRMADMSVKTAEDTTKQITRTLERTQRAA
jgi:phasin family protein